jgi:hypothetical protein
MWKMAIVSRQQHDGSWPSVGMNDRIAIGPYKTIATIIKQANAWGKGKPLRLEIYHSTFVRGQPDEVRYLNCKGAK